MTKNQRHVVLVRNDKALHKAVHDRASEMGISGHRLAQHILRTALGLPDGLPAAVREAA